jgi:hypothetical protein
VIGFVIVGEKYPDITKVGQINTSQAPNSIRNHKRMLSTGPEGRFFLSG